MTNDRMHARLRGDHGFTVMELIVASFIMLAVTGAVFSLMNPAQGTFQKEPEVSDVQQRLRVGVDTLQKDLVMAGAGTYAGPLVGALSFFMAPVMPYNAFMSPTDPSQQIYYRDDAISMLYVPPTPSQTTITQDMPQPSAELKVAEQPNCPGGQQNALCGFSEGDRLIIFDAEGNWDVFTVTNVQDAAAHLQHNMDDLSTSYQVGAHVTQATAAMYHHYVDEATHTYQLRYFDGYVNDVPVVDNVVKMSFKYFGEPQPPQMTGKPLSNLVGPWTTYGPVPPALGTAKNGWPDGENCTFQVQGGVQVPRLQVLGDGGLGQVELTKQMLIDGPWCPKADQNQKFDADLLRIRRIQVTLRVQAALSQMRGPAGPLFMKGGTATGTRMIPDQEVTFDITPRNMNLGR
jgi:hypothetical protein